jgi:hypothetical protein
LSFEIVKNIAIINQRFVNIEIKFYLFIANFLDLDPQLVLYVAIVDSGLFVSDDQIYAAFRRDTSTRVDYRVFLWRSAQN